MLTQVGLNGNVSIDLKVALVAESESQAVGYRMNENVTCECGSEPQTMDHLLRCPHLEQEFRAAGLAVFNARAKDCGHL